MLAERIANYTVRLSADGKRIILGPGSPAWSEFCHTLPASRWNATSRCWTAEFTPAAAWRICSRGDSNPNDLVKRIADDFQSKLNKAHCGKLIDGLIEKTQPWGHQKRAIAFSHPLPASLLAMGMGTGKTLVATVLNVNWQCKTTLILCPKSVLGVWRRELEKHAGAPISVVVLDKGTTKDKANVAEGAMRMCKSLNQSIAIVINYESVWRKDFAEFTMKVEWDCIIADESHKIASHDSSQSKFCAKLGKNAKRRLCLSGTPMTQTPLALFGQFRFLDPGFFGTSWYNFAGRYARHDNKVIPQQITGYKNLEELQSIARMITFQCQSDEVLDLPEAIDDERMFDLCPAAAKTYRILNEELIADVGNGIVTASNALTKLIRLRQLTSGFLIEDETEVFHRLDTGRIDLLRDLLEEAAGEPFVVFAVFTPDLVAIKAVCEDLGLRYGELSGHRRDALNDLGEMSQTIDVAGVMTSSGGVGVDLTRARYAAYYSVGFSLTEYEQSRARLHRPGQTKPQTFYHLIANNTVDARVYKALRERKDVIEAVLEGMRS